MEKIKVTPNDDPISDPYMEVCEDKRSARLLQLASFVYPARANSPSLRS